MSNIIATNFPKSRRHISQLDCMYGTFAVTLAANSVAFGPEDLNVMVREQSTHTSALILHKSDSIFHTIS
jgi:hypothetical protein